MDYTIFHKNIFYLYFQIHRAVRVYVRLVLLFQTVQHVRCVADVGVFWLHHVGMLRVLSHVGHRFLLRFTKIRALHLRERENGLNGGRLDNLRVICSVSSFSKQDAFSVVH